jgi:hypothetical protein
MARWRISWPTKSNAGSQLSVVSAYFTIYAYEALSDELDQIGHLRFLFGEPRFIASLDPEKTDKKSFKIEDEGLELANRLQQKEIARRCASWMRDKVEIRSIRQANLLHGKLYHIDDGRREHAFLAAPTSPVAGWACPHAQHRTQPDRRWRPRPGRTQAVVR